MADTTLDQFCDDKNIGLLDRVLPWRRRALVLRAAQKRLDRMTATVDGIKSDHGLDGLMNDIERVRAQGEAAMEADHDDRQEKAGRKTAEEAAVGGR